MRKLILFLAVAAVVAALTAPAALARSTEGIALPATFEDCSVKKNEIRDKGDKSRLRLDIDCRDEAATDEVKAQASDRSFVPAKFEGENCREKKDSVRIGDERVRIKVDIVCRAESA